MGVLVGFRTHAGVVPFLGGPVGLLMFGFALFWVFAVIGLSVRNVESVQAAAFSLTLPLVFASSVFVQVSKMPGWMQAFARHQPVTAAVGAVRRCVLGGPTTSLVLQSLAWSVEIVMAFTPLAIARYRRVV